MLRPYENINLFHAAQLLARSHFALINMLHAIAKSLLGDADIFDQFPKSTRLDRSRLVATPQRTVECYVPLDQ